MSHVVIHALDVTVPLGLGQTGSDQAVTLVLDALVQGAHTHFGTDPDGLELRASDTGWRFGTGPLVEAPARELLLALAGRRVQGATRSLAALDPTTPTAATERAAPSDQRGSGP